MENYEVQEPRAGGLGVDESSEESLDSGDDSDEIVDEPFPEGDALVQSVIDSATSSWKPTIYINAGSPIRQLNDDQLERVVGAVKDKKGIDIASSADPNTEAARKAAVVVSRMSGLHHLRLRHSRCAEPERVRSSQNAVDIVLETVASSPNIQLGHLSLNCLGGNPETWRRFADRFARSIKAMDISFEHPMTGMASEIAQTIRSGFAALEMLDLLVGRHSDAASVEHLFRAVHHSPTKALGVDYQGNERTVIREVAALCDSLQTLTIRRGPGNGTVRDPSELLVNALRSASLETIDLVEFSLENTSCPSLQRMQPHAANYTMKNVKLTDCEVGEQCLSFLLCFKGLMSLEFDNIVLEPYPPLPTGILAGLESLVSFKESSFVEYGNWHTGNLVWLASDLRAASAPPDVHIYRVLDSEEDDVDPPMPALCDVIANSGTLSLELVGFDGSNNVPFICQGIESAMSLSRLTLTLEGVRETRCAARILDAVERCSSLRRFDGYIRAHNDANDIGPDIEAFFSRNTTLEHFGFDICVSLDVAFEGEIDDDFDRDTSLLTSALVFAVKGLRTNRRLQTLRFYVDGRPRSILEVNAVIGEQVVAMLEESNTSLKRIEGVAYESPQQGERISHLLGLNRHAQDFVANARRVPMGAWGDVLMRISNADCNHFVTELVHRALAGSGDDVTQHARRGKRRRIQTDRFRF
jgi:hypothetical protein